MKKPDYISILRELIITSAPDPKLAAPARDCHPDRPLDEIIPFSSVIVLGTIVAVEDYFRVRVTRNVFQEACADGATLNKLARMLARLHREGSGS